MVVSHDQAVTFELAQGAGQHSLRNAIELSRKLGVAQRPGDAERMDDAERPSIPRMGENLALQAVVVIAQRVTGSLRSGDHLGEVQFIERDQECAFFHMPIRCASGGLAT